MSDMLLLFTIGPVQSYIEQARKTQDLYAGSMILSHLCRTAITASKLSPEQIIFPKNSQSNREQSLPNRFIALVKEADIAELEGDSPEVRLKAFGKSIEKAVKDTFIAIANTVSTPFQDQCPHGFMEQAQGYLNTHWLFLPYTEKEYKAIYSRLERLLKGVKQVRDFALEPEKGRKCSLCGERNVKVYRKNEQEQNTGRLLHTKLFMSSGEVLVVEEKDFTRIEKKFLQPGEGICAICYMKRSAELYFREHEEFTGKYDGDFPSTSDIALFDAIESLKKRGISSIPRTYNAQTVFDVYHKRPNHLLRKEYSHEELEAAQYILKNLQEKDHEIPFGPYYALLHFDGDSMGAWLSGEEHLQYPAQLEQFHRRLSEKLAGFARAARDYVQHPRGRAVYAGGDDFLGFVNLASLFEVLKYLREQFDEQVNKPLFEGENAFVLTDNARLSFSAGIAVAHYKTPLGEVLKWARNMEKTAKAYDGKDAFAIAVLKHSGEIQQMVFPWRMKDDKQSSIWTTDNFEQLMTPLIAKQFSCKFLVNIDREFRRIMNDDDPKTLPFELPKEAFAAEARRLIDRACLMKQQPDQSRKAFQDEKNTAITNMAKHVTRLSLASRHSFENFLSALNVINFFTRKGNL